VRPIIGPLSGSDKKKTTRAAHGCQPLTVIPKECSRMDWRARSM
jgi:hypothetical protein